jgi:hypothetical protein
MVPSKRPRAHSPDLPGGRGHSVPRPTVDELLASQSRFNKVSTDFLKIDLETALTFTQLALQTPDREKKERNRQAARKAYNAIMHLIGRVSLSGVEADHFEKNLRRLKSELIELGESF